jgi:2-polyprenyl-3-methyl-5-hydroxy-6-metoxy-1,4-benzoquinol methylase
VTDFDRDYYSRIYRHRRWRHRGDHPTLYRSIIRLLRSSGSGARLLDVGCGEGQLLRRAQKYFDVHGVDVSEAGVEAARDALGRDVAEVASATALPFADGAFDVVTCLDVLEHIDDPLVPLREISRVLAHGGTFLFSTPNPSSLGHRLKGERSFIYRDDSHVSVLPPAQWRATVAAAGFTVVSDGTDTLWDVPYVRWVPTQVQRVFFLLLAHAMWAVRPFYPWSLGENYVCLCRK